MSSVSSVYRSIKHLFAHNLIIFVILLLSLSFNPSAFAQVTTTLSENPVVLGESFQLIIHSDNMGNETPDLSDLDNDFDVIRQAQSSQFNIINGRTEKNITWTFTLIAKKLGNLTIPPLILGTEKTLPISVKVQKEKPTANLDKTVFLKATTDVSQAYVQQQVLLNLRIYLAINVVSGSLQLSTPTTNQPDSIIEAIGKNKQFNETLNGITYRVIEQQYAIYPQFSGDLDIMPIQFTAQVPSKNQRRSSPFGFGGIFQQNNYKTIRVYSNSIKLNIKPAEFKHDWLVSSAVNLSENWPNSTKIIKLGEPFTRTIMLFADDQTAKQLPFIGAKLPKGLKQYPNKPQLKNQQHSKGITGSRQEKIAISASEAGEYILPAIHIKWWNTNTQKEEIASLPERHLRVIADESATTTQPAPALTTDISTDTQPSISCPENISPQTTTEPIQANYWPWVSLGLGLAWLITLIYLLLDSKNTSITHPAITQNTQVSANLNDVYQAIDNKDFKQLEMHLIQWGKTYYQDNNIHNLNQLSQYSSQDLAAQYRLLETALYSSKDNLWDTAQLNNLLKDLPKQSRITSVKTDKLKPLYPD